jgi:hypothetical protein
MAGAEPDRELAAWVATLPDGKKESLGK